MFDQGEDANAQDQDVQVSAMGTIEMHVKDLPVTKVLQLLSIQSQRNIVASRNVSGKISADLYGVDFYEALDAMLHPNGFAYEEKGSFIYVYTAEEMAEREKASRKPETKIVRLDYLTSADAALMLAPLTSANGKIVVNDEPESGFAPGGTEAGANGFASQETILIHDYTENIEQMLAVLEELDKRPKQVLIEATILQSRLTEENALGVDFSLMGNLDLVDLTNPLSAVSDMISGGGPSGDFTGASAAVGTSAGNTTAGKSGIKAGIMGNDGAIFIRALDSVADTTVLARPKVLVLNRQRTKLLVGQKLGYLSTTQTDTSTTQTVQFLEVGTELAVRPFVSSDEFIRLELKPKTSDGDTTRVIDGFVIPDETTQELTTNVLVRSGQTVVLGGLFVEDDAVARSQVPGLGDVPIVGLVGSGQDDTVQRSEVIFMVKPTVVKDQYLYAASDKAREEIGKTMVGQRDRLLPWSRTKLTNAHVAKALKQLDAGDDEKALWNLNVALYLDPGMVEARHLKDKLTGESRDYMSNSMLDVVDEVIAAEMGVLPDDVPVMDEPEAADEPVLEELDVLDPADEEAPAEDAAPMEEMGQAPAAPDSEELPGEAEAREQAAQVMEMVTPAAAEAHEATEPQAEEMAAEAVEMEAPAAFDDEPVEIEVVSVEEIERDVEQVEQMVADQELAEVESIEDELVSEMLTEVEVTPAE